MTAKPIINMIWAYTVFYVQKNDPTLTYMYAHFSTHLAPEEIKERFIEYFDENSEIDYNYSVNIVVGWLDKEERDRFFLPEGKDYKIIDPK